MYVASGMKYVLISIVNLVFLVGLGFFFSEKICLLHKHYTTQSNRIRDERWLRLKCSDPIFYSNLKTHTSFCEEVESTFQIGPMWYALAQVSESLPFGTAWGELKCISWQIAAITAVVLILFPSIIIGCVRSAYNPPPMAYHPHVMYPTLKQV